MFATLLDRAIRRRREFFVVMALYVACLVVLGPKLRFSQWYIAPENNVAAAEAMAWLDGRLDLPGRGGDTALFDGKVYSIFPPLWTMVSYVVYGLYGRIVGGPVVFHTLLYIALLAGTIPLLFYLACRRSGSGPYWAGVLAFYAMAGTCLWPVAASCYKGWIYSNQHVTAQIGLALLLLDLLGAKRLWPAGIGLMIAVWSRYLCIFFALPILWTAWKQERRAAALLRAGIPIAIAVGVPMMLNQAKFGSPFESGYRYLYVDAEGSELAKVIQPDGSLHFFSTRNMPAHARGMWLAPPWIDFSFQGLTISGSAEGTGLFYGSPLLLLVLIDVKRWWRDPIRRVLMLSSIPLIVLLSAYYGPGYGTPGYYRYTLDFTLIWLVAIAPGTEGPARRWFTLTCLLWSVFYFYMVG